MGNIVTGDELQTKVVIDFNGLPFIRSLLDSPRAGIKKEACWTISNITAGSKYLIQAVIDANIFPPLINLLRAADSDVKKEAAWAIANATSGGSSEQVGYLVTLGCINPLCDLLEPANDALVGTALEGLENILRVGASDSMEYVEYFRKAGGVDKLKQLRHHANFNVSTKALNTLETYFGDDDDDGTL